MNKDNANNCTTNQGDYMDSTPGESAIMKVAYGAMNVALNGFGPFKSARALAESFTGSSKYMDDDERIRALIRSQCWRSGGSGFVTGLGGGTTLVIGGIAVDMASVLAINIRMVAAIAIIRGYDINDGIVRAALLLTAIGTSLEEALGNVGIQIGKAGCKALINKIPRKLIGKINRFFGKAIISKFSKRGLIQLGKAVPVVGGLVGGAINAAGCRSIGKLACRSFSAQAAA